MKNTAIIATVPILFGLAGAVGSAKADQKPSSYQAMLESDANLTKRIEQELLANQGLPADDWESIDVNVKNGHVSLSGRVSTEAQKKLVEDTAKRLSSNQVFSSIKSDEEMKEFEGGGG
jgi:osmotically-inducible protein OsmY